MFHSDHIDEHSPYNVWALLSPWEDNETLILNRSREVTLKLGFNSGPSSPFNITPRTSHNRTPLIKWNASVDPDKDPVSYHLSIGTSPGSNNVVSGHDTTDTFYQVASPLDFQRHHITMSAHTPDGNSSSPAIATLDIVNSPPVLEAVEDEALYLEDSPTLHFFLNASDPDTDPVDILTYGANTTLFTINSTSGEVNWTPTEADLGTHVVNYTVTDGFANDYDLVIITVAYKNEAPVANAGEDINATVDTKVFLNGSGSYDTDGMIIEYKWTPDRFVLLNISEGARPWFVPGEIGNFSFTLSVKDDGGAWSANTDTVVVTVSEKEPEQPKVEPGLTLRDAGVTPTQGVLNDTYVFSVTGYGTNITQEMIALVNDTALIQVEIDGGLKTWDVPRAGIGTADPEKGVLFALSVPGSMLGLGNHTFRFICNYDNVSGDVGGLDGPRVMVESVDDDIGDDDTVDDDDDTSKSTMVFCFVLLLMFLVLGVFLGIAAVVLIKQRSVGGLVEEDEEMDEEESEEDDDDLFDLDEFDMIDDFEE